MCAGNHLYASADIVSESGLQIGERVTTASFEAARQKIQKTDLFATISYSFKYEASSPPKYDLVLTVVEDDQVYPLHFERLGADPEQIRAYLKTHIKFYSDTIPGTESVVARYKQAVQEFLKHEKSKGPTSRVTKKAR